MSYLVLARRWRPTRFDELVGQSHVTKTLLNGMRQGRVAHAYLFCGPRGVGKTTAARLVARALNCIALDNGEPCGKCDPCVEIAQGRFIDSIEIDAASNTGVDDVRKLREGIRYAPINGKAKVYVIDEVHMLSSGAFNALLKTLEEPPEHAYFCLATTEPHKLPATIISRCQRFDFRRVPASEIRKHLIKICTSEKFEYDEEALDIVARRADGSIRDSLSLLDQVIAFAGGNVLKQDTIEVLGEVGLDRFFRAVDLVRTQSVAEAFNLDEDLAYTGTDPQDYLSGLEHYIILLLQAKSIGFEEMDIPQDAISDFKTALGSLSDADLMRMLQYTTIAETDVRRNYNPRVRLQLLFMKFASFDRSVILAEALKSFSGGQHTKVDAHSAAPALKKRDAINNKAGQAELSAKVNTSADSSLKSGSHLDESSRTDEPPDPTRPDKSDAELLASVQNNWSKICDKIAETSNSRGRMMQFIAYPVSFKDGRVTVNFTNQNQLDAAKSCRNLLQKEMTALVGYVIVDMRVGEIPVSQADSDEDDNDPQIQMLKDRFGARPLN